MQVPIQGQWWSKVVMHFSQLWQCLTLKGWYISQIRQYLFLWIIFFATMLYSGSFPTISSTLSKSTDFSMALHTWFSLPAGEKLGSSGGITIVMIGGRCCERSFSSPLFPYSYSSSSSSSSS